MHAGILQEAMGRGEYWRLIDSQGRPPGLLGMWPSRAVTFIENHDTGSTLNHWPFPSSHLLEGYAYIITHPGSPCIFYDHFFAEGLGQGIREMIKIRSRLGIQCRSKVRHFRQRWLILCVRACAVDAACTMWISLIPCFPLAMWSVGKYHEVVPRLQRLSLGVLQQRVRHACYWL